MLIRPVHPSDFSDLFQLFGVHTPVYFHPAEVKDYANYLARYGSTYFVAKVNGVIAGGCGYHYSNEKYGRISWVFTDPAFKGMRIGRQLVSFCLDALRKEGRVEEVEVWTSQHANQFFQRFGFELVSVKADYWAKGLDLYQMRMALAK